MRHQDYERQKVIVRLLARGFTEKEIAREVKCSRRAVQYDKSRVANRLNIQTRQLKFLAAAGKVET